MTIKIDITTNIYYKRWFYALVTTVEKIKSKLIIMQYFTTHKIKLIEMNRLYF